MTTAHKPKTNWQHGLIVKSSPLHGAGVYTTVPLKKGQRVLEYTGPRITKKQSELLYADSEVTYLFGMDGGKIIIDGFGMAAFVNHSCDPNCETDQIAGRIWIIATQAIKPGEELTYDYNLYDATQGEEAPCYCGGKTCRGTMFSEDEIARLKRASKRKNGKLKKKVA